MPEGSPSVLIIRLDAIGDALALTPLLAAFARRSIAVDVVLRRTNAGIFSSRAARAIVLADFDLRSNAARNLAAIADLGGRLRARAYSHVLVATEDAGGYRLAAATSAPVRIGFADPWGKPFKALWSRRSLTQTIYRSAGLDPRAPHECEVLFPLGRVLIGDEAPSRDAGVLRPLVLEREPACDDRIALQVTREWERLGIALRRGRGARPARCCTVARLLASSTEAAYARTVAEAMGLEIAYFDELEPWKAAIAAAPAIVTPDSGALHVAGMIGTPVVAVFPPQRRYALQVARWSPWAAPHRIVRADAGWPARAADAAVALLS